jgi:hypothetical protein
MTIKVAGRYVEIVENPRFIDQTPRRLMRKFRQQLRKRVSPRLLLKPQVRLAMGCDCCRRNQQNQ